MTADSQVTGEDAWRHLQRGLEYDGELRANRLRLLAIVLFYSAQVVSYFGISFGERVLVAPENLDTEFHIRVTLLAVTWAMLACGLTLAIRGRIFPWWTKYLSTSVDLILLTSVLLIAGGARSAMVVGYFVVIALSSLRFHLGLIRCATIGAGVCYLILNAVSYWGPSGALTVPVYQLLMTIIAIAFVGVILGQLVRKVRRTAMLYADRIVSQSVEEAA